MRGRLGMPLLGAVSVGGSYALAAALGLQLAGDNPNVTAVWPPTGIAVAGLILCGRRIWPAIAIAAFAANLVNGAGPATAAAISIGNTLAPLVAVELCSRLRFRPTLDRLVDVATLVFAGGFVAMLVSSSLGTLSLVATGATAPQDALAVFFVWWIGDALGVVLVAPLVLSWAQPSRAILDRPAEAAAMVAAAAIYAVLVYPNPLPFQFLIFPIAGWAALRLGMTGASTQVAVVALVTIVMSTRPGGAGPFGTLVFLQLFNGVVALTSIGVAAVVAERQAAQDELRQLAANLEARVSARTRELAEAQRIASVGSWTWDSTENNVTWSDELMTIYGMDVTGGPSSLEDYLARIHPDHVAQVISAVRRAHDTGEPFAHDYRIVRPSGEVRWVSARGEAVRDEKGLVTTLRGVCHDITSRRAAEEAVRVSEERFRSVLRGAPDAVVVVDESGHIVLANDQAAELFGYDGDELVGLSVEMLVPGHSGDVHRAHRARYGASPRRRPMGAGRDLTAMRKDGTEVPVDISLSPLESTDGLLVIAAVRDVTDRRLAEEHLRGALAQEKEAAERMRKVDAMKDAFLAAVSHELRTPLTSVLGLAMTIQRPEITGSPQDVVRMAGRIVANADRLQRLLSDLLDLDRLSRGVIEPQRRPTDLRSLCREVIEHSELGGRTLTVDVERYVADVDPAQTERIIENLLVNAARHTARDAQVWLRAGQRDGGVFIVVEDSGEGVPDEDKESIFLPFQRGGTQAARARGTGVGLALVAKFAELHGGSAAVHDRPGGGASFHVWLPARASAGGEDEEVQIDGNWQRAPAQSLLWAARDSNPGHPD